MSWIFFFLTYQFVLKSILERVKILTNINVLAITFISLLCFIVFLSYIYE